MMEAGILDPTKVTISALQNATSVASTLLTTETVVANIKEETPADVYKRQILTRYKKLKDENKQACDLMLHYSEDLRLAHRMKEWFYDICPVSYTHLDVYKRQK